MSTSFFSSRVISRWVGAAVLTAGAVLAGCATPPTDPAERATFEHNNDPLEPLNRKTFALNEGLDHVILKPAAQAYMTVVPSDARTAIHHVLDNLKEPTLAFNNVLQGEFKRAEISVGRFIVNTTVGFGGVVDVMTLSGVERQPADFGQTMFVWGVPSGPYLVLPILGPTTVRDSIGEAVDSYADPTMILVNENSVSEVTTWRFVVGGMDERARVMDVLDDLERNSVDFYAEMRSLWQQHRAAELRHGKAPDAAPGLYDDPGQSAPPPAPKPGAANAAAVNVASAAPWHPASAGRTHVATLPPMSVTAIVPSHAAGPAPRPSIAHTAGNAHTTVASHTATAIRHPTPPPRQNQVAQKPAKPARLNSCVTMRCAGRAT